MFEKKILELGEFSKKWRSYLKKVKIDDEEVANTNELAVTLRKEGDRCKKQLDSFVFNKKIIFFEKYEKGIEKSSLGVIKFKSVGGYDLNDFKQINISGIVGIGTELQLYPQENGTFIIVYIDNNSLIKQVTIDYNRDKKTLSILYSQSRSSVNLGFQYNKFNKNIYGILALFIANGVYYLERRSLLLRRQKLEYPPIFISECDTYVYSFGNNQLNIYSKAFTLIKSIGQQNMPAGPFYFPNDIKQFECKNGKYFWLNKTHFQIMNEVDGELIKSIEVKSNNFVYDSKDRLVLLNQATKELNYFNYDGVLVDNVSVDYNQVDGLDLSLRKDGEAVFLDNKDKKILFNY